MDGEDEHFESPTCCVELEPHERLHAALSWSACSLRRPPSFDVACIFLSLKYAASIPVCFIEVLSDLLSADELPPRIQVSGTF